MTTTKVGPITPCLWFNDNAGEAARFYASLFPGSRVTSVTTLRDTPSGDADVVWFEMAGHPFMALNGGPQFEINPSISFILNFDPSRDPDARERLDATWRTLAEGGTPLMPLDKSPFSERYGWIQDRFGVSWQLILSDPNGEERPFLVPALLFTGPVAGRAEDAIRFYTGLFPNSRVGTRIRHGPGQAPDKEGTILFADFMLDGQWFAAMDSARAHGHPFNEAISLMVRCETQAEIDAFWDALTAVPEAEQCGWLKDRFGVSWQITPALLDEIITKGTREQIDRATQALLPMKKLDVAALAAAARGA